jgi:glycine/D-amino acid oxidase-like deaminating enzyme
MRTRYGVSPWIEAVPARRRGNHPRLRGEHTARVVIVGGGLTGCAVAQACAAAGLAPVLVEADRIGQGSSGRGAGLLLPDPGVPFRDAVAGHGLRAARLMFQAWRKASLDAAASLRRLGVPCALESCDSLTVGRAGDEKALKREIDARTGAGLDVRGLTAAQARRASAFEAIGGMRQSGAFALDPYRAALGLAKSAATRGATLFERTPVRKVRFGRRQAEVVVEGGLVRADTVIICTGLATAEFRPLRRHFRTRETYLVLTEPVPAVIRRLIGARDVVLADMAEVRQMVRWTRDGRVLVGGGDRDEPPARQREAVRVQRTGQLMYELLLKYPAISGLRPEFGWESAYGRTADGLPYVGPHRNYPHHLFALGGEGSATGAFLAARLLARAAAGAPEKGDDVFGWTR